MINYNPFHSKIFVSKHPYANCGSLLSIKKHVAAAIISETAKVICQTSALKYKHPQDLTVPTPKNVHAVAHTANVDPDEGHRQALAANVFAVLAQSLIHI